LRARSKCRGKGVQRARERIDRLDVVQGTARFAAAARVTAA
jgi:hypothetical protein